MNAAWEPSVELTDLIEAICHDDITSEQAARLEELVLSDPSARRYYVRYLHMHASLPQVLLTQGRENDECGMGGNDECRMMNDELPESASGEWRVESGEPSIQRPFSNPPILVLPVQHSAFSIQQSFFGGVVFSYLVATVILGTALAIAWAWKLSEPAQIAGRAVPGPSPLVANNSARMQFVGRITGMVDCRWEKRRKNEGGRMKDELPTAGNGIHPSSFIPHPSSSQSLVSLGDKFALSAGLLEITYDSGAKVILQGPVTYEVESKDGGYLSVGKLTARMENKDEGRVKNEELTGSRSSFLIPHSYFSVKTPTATVTDLGTEFGVTVSEKGLTEVHVFQGAVDAQIAGLPDDAQRHERVTEERAVQIRPKSVEIEAVAFAPQPFTRKLEAAPVSPTETAYINAVLADKPMGYWPLNEPANARKFLDRSGNGFHGYAMREVAMGQPGPLFASSRSVELDGRGYIDVGRRDEFAMKNDFTVESWVWIGQMNEGGHVLSVLGEDDTGWGLIAGRRNGSKGDAENPLVLYFIAYRVGHFHFSLSKDESIENRWLHVAATYDRDNTVSLYLNGEPRGSIAARGPALVGPVWLQIGCARLIDVDHWRGRLAHLAVYPRALSSQQIQNHYSQRNERAVGDK